MYKSSIYWVTPFIISNEPFEYYLIIIIYLTYYYNVFMCKSSNKQFKTSSINYKMMVVLYRYIIIKYFNLNV